MVEIKKNGCVNHAAINISEIIKYYFLSAGQFVPSVLVKVVTPPSP